ncbi:hypothetical protein EDD15DRAFT_2375518 [Pisolithus albus]|nr:hypothetical protein EDD15DRAFT_2375518 [Pisolithus albus]
MHVVANTIEDRDHSGRQQSNHRYASIVLFYRWVSTNHSMPQTSKELLALKRSHHICPVPAATMYSYSKSRGLFEGVSVEGSVIVEQQDANALAYNQNVTAKMLLSGMVPRLEWASSLVRTLEACTSIPGTRRWINDRVDEPASYPFDASGTPGKPSLPVITSGGRCSLLFGKKKKDVDFSPQHWGTSKNSGSYFAADDLDSHEDFGSTLSSHPLD